MNILLTADEAAGAHAFRLLNDSHHEVKAVITPEENFTIRSLATRTKTPVLNPSKLTDPNFATWIRQNNIDVLLNVHLLYIIHPAVIEAVSAGAFNLHPGPLPTYAGLNTPSWAIYNGEKEYGVTLHWLEKGIDTGHIAYRESVLLNQQETGLTLSTKCAHSGMNLISKLLKNLSEDCAAIPRIPQNITGRRYFKKKEIPQNGCITWAKTSTEIDAFVRASNYSPFKSPWGFPKTTYKGSEVKISSVSLTDVSCCVKPGTINFVRDEVVRVATADNWLAIKTCGVNGSQVPAHTIFCDGDVLG
ncbi:MAG: formyltransferase family protein [Balneolaceae bacterium]